MTDRPASASPFDPPRAASPDEWRQAFVPLGVTRGEGAWAPVGAGVLLVDAPVLWLVTARSVLEAAGAAPLVAWVATTGPDGAALVDLTTGRAGGDLDWVRHPERDVAACVFPVGPGWRLKAFNEARTLPEADLVPLLVACVAGCAYGLGAPAQRPSPLGLDGAIAGVDGRVILTTAPLLPRNAGAPLLVPLPAQAGGGVALAGIATHAVAVPEAVQSTLPPVRLTVAAPIAVAFEALRSERGKAARRAALATRSTAS